jgi:putative DNA primase/helicase
MSKKIDADAVKNSRSIDDVIGGYVDLKQNGTEFEACCPFHKEKTPSFRVIPQKDFYYCFGCGATGDSIDFVQEFTGASFRDACEVIAGRLDITADDIPQRKVERIDPYERYKPTTLAPDVAIPKPGQQIQTINPKRDHKTSKFKPSHVWPYRDAAGNLVAIVIRFDIDGKKITPCLRWCRWDGGEGWVMYAMSETARPLYNLTGLIGNAGHQVIVVEGEKATQYLQDTVGQMLTVVSWSGGTKRINATDWTPLNGRRVIIIPDADEPGFDAAADVMQQLITVGAESIKVVIPEDTRPKGWDVADEVWRSADAFIDWAKSRIGSLPQPEPDQPVYPDQEEPDYQGQDEYFNEQPQAPAKQKDQPRDMGAPYQILGYSADQFYFLPHGSQQIKAMTAPALAQKANLMTLAPTEHWRNFAGLGPDEDLKSQHWEMHVNGIIQQAYKEGVFDLSRIRGRGAWIDNDRNILHVGDCIYIDGKPTLPEEVDSKNIYPRELGMKVEFTTPATNAQANHLVKITERLSWDRKLSGALLAGWCVIAPLCGMLRWRPHIWVTGPSGAGKSTVLNDIVGVMLGGIGVTVEGKTTEAGIRQMLGNDARPILFDEAEAEDEASMKRMQGILDFARVSSSGGKIIKGTTGGRSMEFSARSAFCFSSINTTVKYLADEARITKLILQRDTSKNDEYWGQLENDIKSLITEDFANQMISRSITHMSTIKQNIEVFVRAATTVFKSRRIADQVGTMLAGTYLCYSTNVITTEQAREWIERFDWTDHTIVAAKSDPERLIEKIATKRVQIINDERQRVDITIGEAILIAARVDMADPLTGMAADCRKELRRNGMKQEGDQVIIANNCGTLSVILSGSPWESSWSRTLSEIEGATKADHQHFSPGIKSRGISIPISVFAE